MVNSVSLGVGMNVQATPGLPLGTPRDGDGVACRCTKKTNQIARTPADFATTVTETAMPSPQVSE
jgi:hypothetical protein